MNPKNAMGFRRCGVASPSYERLHRLDEEEVIDMAVLPRLVLILALLGAPLSGYSDQYNIPDPTELDSTVYGLEPTWDTPALAFNLPDTRSSEVLGRPQPAVMSVAAPPIRAYGTSLFTCRQRPVPRRERDSSATHQYAWFAEEEERASPTRQICPITASQIKRSDGNGGACLRFTWRYSALSAWPAASWVHSLRLACFRRGA